MYSKLQYISQGNDSAAQLKNIQQSLDAGCDWVQLRFKNKQEMLASSLAEKVKLLCQQYKSVFIVNDFVDIAKQVDADGLHLGLTDGSIVEARKILGDTKIIGGSANTLADVIQRMNKNCNYVGLGPFRHTITKEKLSPILGIEGYKKIIAQLDETQLKTPIYAIGGILPEDAESIAESGIYGVAVSGVISYAVDKKQIVEQFKTSLYATT